MQRTIIAYLILTITTVCACAMDFGLRFKSHNYPLEHRTAVTFSNSPIVFNDELMIGFHFNFYTQPLFGTLLSITTDNGNSVSVVASHQGHDAYLLGLVVNEKMKLMSGLISVDRSNESKIDLSLNRARNVAVFNYNNNEIELPLDLSKTKSANVVFGIDKDKDLTDAAPIEVRNVRIFVDKINTNYWDFKYHDAPAICIDEINGAEARVENPHWLIDDHTDWHLLYSETVKDTRQTAFDPKTENFYIVGKDKIKVWNPLSGDSSEYAVKNDLRPMAYSNHLAFDTVSGNLVNYNLSKRNIATFLNQTGEWKAISNTEPNEEANYANHTFALDGNVAYAFGGYGFYKFHNDLFKINFETGAIEECKLQPEMMPATSAAACVVGDKLYIFGGKGNASGRQELPSKYQYAMYAYDVNNWQGGLLWQLDSVRYDFLPSQSMYYDSLEDCFYAASTCHGGELIKISRTRPEVSEISTPINSKMEYHDIVFDLFQSKDGKRYYLLIDKRTDHYTHDYSIYTISAPFLEDPVIIHNKSIAKAPASANKGFNWWILALVLAAAAGIIIFLLVRSKRQKNKAPQSSVPTGCDSAIEPAQPNAPVADKTEEQPEMPVADMPAEETPAEDMPIAENDSADDDLLSFEKRGNATTESKFDRSKSAISILGTFNVRNKDGEDITIKFTDRLKSLLILLLLANNKNKNGIKYQTIDEEIWGDKDDKSAQNNRNVYMRKLRVLFEEVGDISITYDKGYFKVENKNVMYDYGEAVARISEIESNGNASPELINETLDLLLMGPLLPMTTYEWLDQYKADYSDRSLEILNKLLKYEFHRNDQLSFKIAQTISCHEPLSEEAMKAKCILFIRKKMVGQAQKVYARYCKEYLHCMGEEYKVSFPEVCKSQF